MQIKLSKLVCIGFILFSLLMTAGTSSALTITTGDQTVTENSLLSFTVSTDDVNATITVDEATLPAGANFASSTHTFSWTPSAGAAGTYRVTFNAASGNQSTSKDITITVVAVEIVDKTALTMAITSANTKVSTAVAGVEIGQYPQTAIDTFKAAIAAAQAVADSTTATQTQVNQAITTLQAAQATFDASIIASIDKTALTTAITAANTKVAAAVAGTGIGQYPQTAIDNFKAAIATAQTVANTATTQAAVNQALTTLKAAETTFDAAKVTGAASVTNLKESATGKSWITWTWTNPTTDFGHVMIYIDGTFITTTTNVYYNATGFAEGTVHTIGTQTVDANGNINPTTVSDQATTKVTDLTPPGPVTNLHETNAGASWIYWTWTKPADTDFSNARISIDGTFVTTTPNSYYNATGLTNGVEHTISITTVDTSGNENTAQVSDAATTLKLPVISNVIGKSIKADSITLEWAVSDDTAAVQIIQNGIILDNVTESIYVHSNLNSSTTYNYILVPYNMYGLKGEAVSISLTTSTTTEDLIPPASVTNLKETGAGQNWIKWTWVNPTDVDFSHVMVYLDGVFVTNTSDEFYEATGLGDLYISDLSLEDEQVKIKNVGSSAVNLTGWQIKDEDDKHTYTFPPFQLGAGATVTLYTAEGSNTETELYWGSGNPFWNNEGDTAYLYNSGGYLVDSLRGGATHTIEGTTHVISTRTADTSGNINPIWVNDSATTSSASSGSSGGGGSSSKKSSSGGGGGGAGSAEVYSNVAVKDVDSEYLRINANVIYEFSRPGNDIQSVSFYSLKNSGEITSTIEVLNSRSKLVNSTPEGFIYKYVNIWVGKAGFATAANIENARIKFKVDSFWIHQMGVSPSDIRLQRYNGTAWEVLPTVFESNITNYAIFESQTPGFSPFAITAEKVLASSTNSDLEVKPVQTADAAMEETQSEKSNIWTFILVIFLIGVFAVGYEYLKRK